MTGRLFVDEAQSDEVLPEPSASLLLLPFESLFQLISGDDLISNEDFP